MERLITQPQPVQGRGPDVCQQYVRVGQKLQHGFFALRRFQVDRNQGFAAVLNGEQRVFVILADHHFKLARPALLVAYGGLDLDDLGAVSAEHPAGCGGGHHCGKLNDLYAFQWHFDFVFHVFTSCWSSGLLAVNAVYDYKYPFRLAVQVIDNALRGFALTGPDGAALRGVMTTLSRPTMGIFFMSGGLAGEHVQADPLSLRKFSKYKSYSIHPLTVSRLAA